MPKPKVLILTGSKNDLEQLRLTEDILRHLRIPYELVVSSAHRNPDRTRRLAARAEKRGIKVIIAAAGLAAHLAGVVASLTTLPVIGIPLPGSYFRGIDSFLSTLQMPAGTPVATVAVGSHGARNAAILAAQILALSDEKLKRRLKRYKAELAKK
ncbi:MAG: 5-(carboxyamino)imidazole ribonucleotide mutase [candidate division Zixibacteria bacterium RBG_16_48_11]|nr:MAG: 5-(carboxyamino)imidazole ribonucleotide mutase [candidate division Zixibacteria bacterium RBG_16_48_11]